MNTKQIIITKWLKQMGVDEIYQDQPINHMTAMPTIQANKNASAGEPIHDASADFLNQARALADSASTIAELKAAVESFEGCKIKKMALNTVFADGCETADIMMIGEAPGASEDQQGIPFCGQSGKLLDNLLPSIGLTRKDVYISNTLFWRPPGNRRPTAHELDLCRPFVEKHIKLINPKIIILVGSTAVESMLGSKLAMHGIRSNMYDYTNQYLDAPIKTYVIFHPSYLLRQPTKKKLMWYDMLRIKEYIENGS